MQKLKHIIGNVLRKLFPKQMELRSIKADHQVQLQRAERFASFTEEDWVNYDKALYFKTTGHELNLETPQCFSEKIQWRKLFDIDLIYAKLSDKLAVRDWVAKKIGPEYLIPLLAVYDSADKINFDELPDQFVMKTNNASATNTIVTCKAEINKRLIRENYRFWMQYPFGYHTAERHYNLIEPKIIVEKYMEPEAGKKDLVDYKFLCFNGKVHYCWVDLDRYHGHKRKVYTLDWNAEPWTMGPYGFYEESVPRPKCLEEMIFLAEKLSTGFAHVRVDFYEIKGKVYFGEMTFTSASGFENFTPDEWDYKIGALWDINGKQIDEALVDI